MVWRELPRGVGENKAWFWRPQMVHEIAHNPLVLLQGSGFVYVELITDDQLGPPLRVSALNKGT